MNENEGGSGIESAQSKPYETVVIKDEDPGKKVIIWAFGEMGGATEWFNPDLHIGAHLLLENDLKNGNAPDHIIFNGGVLPDVPPHVTKVARDKLNSLLRDRSR